MKIIVIYDSKTGNTEKMAKAIAEGAGSVADVLVKKIGEAFPLTKLAEVDGVIFGSPVYYADISNNMKDFLDHIKTYSMADRKTINNIPAAVFGSYGYDGAWLMEEKLKDMVKGLGYTTYDDVLVMVDSDLKYNHKEAAKKCREFGKKFAESL